MKRLLAAALVALLTPCLATAALIVSEDFEEYADTAELGAVWSLGDGTLDTAFGNPGQSMNHPGTGASFGGGNTNTLGFAEVIPSGSQKLVFSTDIFDDGSSANKRTTAGIRRASGANLIEMGMYNGPGHYAYRVVLFDGSVPVPSWVAFGSMVDDAGDPLVNAPLLGGIASRSNSRTPEQSSRSTLTATATSTPRRPSLMRLNAAGGFDIVRLGGPSDFSSAGGGVKFDNVSVSLVPEPASALLALLACAGFVARRR